MEQRYGWAYTYVLSARSAAALGDTTAALRAFELGYQVTKAEPELTYAYVLFLHARGEWQKARPKLDESLKTPALRENPVGEGELRLELAKSLSVQGDEARAREELRRATQLIPREDEARADADSMLQHFGMK